MGALSTVGGLLSLMGGILIVIETFIIWGPYWAAYPVADVINLGIGLAAIIGGVFGMKGQRGAGGVSLVVGVLSIVLGLLVIGLGILNYSFVQFSLIAFELNVTVLYVTTGISIEAIIIAVGGILILAGGGSD